MVQLALFALIVWCALALLAVPLVLSFGRAAYHADVAQQHEYDALRPTTPLTV